jgi:hypothetical protein
MQFTTQTQTVQLSEIPKTLNYDSDSWEKITLNTPNKEILSEVFRVLKKNGILEAKGLSELDLMSVGFSDTKISNNFVIAKKPDWNVGQTFSIKKSWTLSLDDDTMDEDSLLKPEDLVKPKKTEKCDTKKKACKDCSCGLKEEQEVKIQTTPVKSNCGSCGLGDAFRCGGCPYLGLPPFKPGEKIEIKL